MTLSLNEPTDQRLVSELPSYIRENRAAINDFSAAGAVGNTDLVITAGTTLLTIGVDLGTYGVETIKCSGLAANTISYILAGTEGQIKIFIFQDGFTTFQDSTLKITGTLYLHQLPSGGTFNPQQNDVIAFVNIGGDGATANGYWKELYRTIALK